MPQMVEIYGLHDPITGELRYIGKANDSPKRFKGHMGEHRRKTPLYSWIDSLRAKNQTPVLSIITVCDAAHWCEEEKNAIAGARVRGERLLNLAAGGDEPYCSKEVRAANGRKVAAKVHSDPVAKKIWGIKKCLADNLLFFKRHGLKDSYNRTAAKMRECAAMYPHMCGAWATLEDI